MQQDETAFLEAVDAHRGIIRKVANSYCRDVSEREDLIQEITIQLWRSWNKYDPKFKLTTWIYRVALNVAISFYRSSNRHRAINNSPARAELVPIRVDEGLNDNIRQLYEFIGELDELNRAVILLYLERFSHDEIAQTLGISKTNVATKISRIRQRLKRKFAQIEELNEH